MCLQISRIAEINQNGLLGRLSYQSRPTLCDHSLWKSLTGNESIITEMKVLRFEKKVSY